MSAIPPPDYLSQRRTQLEAALARRDGDLAVGIIRLIEADGYGDFAHDLTRRPVEVGLNNMATGRTR